MTAETIGQRLAHLRRARGWRQVEVAAAVGVLRTAISRWERDVAVPSTPFVFRLAEVFSVSPVTLWSGQP